MRGGGGLTASDCVVACERLNRFVFFQFSRARMWGQFHWPIYIMGSFSILISRLIPSLLSLEKLE